jgi:hypothetical protein
MTIQGFFPRHLEDCARDLTHCEIDLGACRRRKASPATGDPEKVSLI